MHTDTYESAASAVATVTEVSGLCAGTAVLTMDGELPVEHISVGDRVITRDTGMCIVKNIRVKDVKIQPIRIKAGSLGHTRPDRDMVVPAGARIHIRDWRAEAIYGKSTVNVAAKDLVDNEFLTVMSLRETKVFELQFDREHIIYADGIEMIAGAS